MLLLLVTVVVYKHHNSCHAHIISNSAEHTELTWSLNLTGKYSSIEADSFVVVVAIFLSVPPQAGPSEAPQGWGSARSEW